MADEVDSKSIGGNTVRVQVPQPALLGRGESLKNNIVYVIFKAFSFFQKAKVIKKVINHMFETSEEGENLAQMRLIWYQKDILC